MSVAPPMIAAAGVRMQFGRHVALHGVDLTIAAGEMFALIGPDGAGKTTFFRLVAGLARPSAGTITRGRLRTFGFVPQRFGLYDDLSVDENITLRAQLYGFSREVTRSRADGLLRRVGLDRFGARLAGALSGGMKQKLALVAALITEPELLLLDEPTTGVDPVSRREFWGVLNQLHHGGMTILVSTPYMDEAEYATRIGFLDDGRLIAVGSPEEVLATYPRALVEVRSTERVAVEARLRTVASADDVSLFGTRLHVRGHEGTASDALLGDVRRALDGVVPPEAIAAAAPSLEDVFVLEGERRAEAGA